jgi:hypothetical protein
MKRTPVRRKLPTTTSCTTTPRAEISWFDPGSANSRSTSVRGMMNVPRGRFMVMPEGVMSSAWQSWTFFPIAFLTAKTAGTRSVCRRSAGARRRSTLMPSS